MESQGLLLDVVTYNVILDGFCRQGKMHEADMIYRKMIKKGLDPDRSTDISLINGHVSQENMKEAFRYHDQMLQRGPEHSYKEPVQIIINALSRLSAIHVLLHLLTITSGLCWARGALIGRTTSIQFTLSSGVFFRMK
ncbi:pentatricopeptide repeat-containing protein [Tanacetum coccineum]